MKRITIAGMVLLACIVNIKCQQSINVDVNLNVKQTVGGISEFDRAKFINLHAHQTEAAWDLDQLSYILYDLDVYMGRDNETGHRDLRFVREDPDKPGFPDIEQMKELGLKSRKWYDKNTQFHEFESRNNSIITTHTFPLFPAGRANEAGWVPVNATASGQWVANHIKEYYGDRDGIHGEPVPKYFEVVNEPMWTLVTTSDISTPAEIFEYHNTVADEIRAAGNDIMIGGYCAAFPDFDKDDFKRWEKRDKLFIDMSGEKMDFYTIHLYDFPVFNGLERYRRGSNVEATLDMLEHYNVLRHGDVKPLMCTEFGAQTHDRKKFYWDPYREWMVMKALNSITLSFMDRPDNILISMPYIVGNGSYQYDRDPSLKPHERSILRPDKNGEWRVFTDLIKFYQFWADVKGTRVDSESADLDIQVDAYVDGKNAYLILDNLDFVQRTIKPVINEDAGLKLEKVMVKHFHESDSLPVIDTIMYSGMPEKLQLDKSGTMIIKLTYSAPVPVNQSSDELKYYADTCYIKIVSGQNNVFKIANVSKTGCNGEAILRLGIGRKHGKSLSPSVLFNGTEIPVPSDWKGDDQRDRETYFGVREIPVPYKLLRKNNTVNVTFPDGGGYISSVTLRAFAFSKELSRSFK